MAVTKSDVFANDTTGMENKTVIVTTILVNVASADILFVVMYRDSSMWLYEERISLVQVFHLEGKESLCFCAVVCMIENEITPSQ